MAIVNFAQVERHAAHVIITAYGESGCGKTYSLIRLGRGLVGPKGKLGMIDTETGRGKIYANVAGGYLYAELTPPFTPERYIEAIDAAEQAGIEALIIDSGSHEWEGLGGVLEIAEANTLKGLAKWAAPKSRHKKYVQRLLNSRMHLLISLRAKEKMIQLTDKTPIPKGYKIGDIVSDGFVPIQDKRFIFETTVQLFMPLYAEHNRLGMPVVEKCPGDLIGAFHDGSHISEETGQRIVEWVNGGTPVDHELEQLKRDAEEAAAGGLNALRTHWRKLAGPARDRLGPHSDNLRSIAEAADAENERRRSEGHNAFEQVGGETDQRSDEGLFDHPNSPTDAHEPAADTPAGEPAQPGLALGGDEIDEARLQSFRDLVPGDPPNWPGYADHFVWLCENTNAVTRAAVGLSRLPHAMKCRTESGDDYRRMQLALNAR